jgi:hypothetical protein
MIPPEIENAAQSGELVVFVGAGISRLINCPSWDGFADRVLEQLVPDGLDYYELSQIRSISDPKKRLSIAKIVAQKKGIKIDYTSIFDVTLKPDNVYGYSQAQLLLNANIEETKIRNWFADELRKLNQEKYNITTEDEYADATRPDLNIHSPTVNSPIVIELKKTDNWTAPKLTERLHNQLVGQYMRDVHSRYGIYLLVWQGKWKRKLDGRKLTFYSLLNILQEEADNIVHSRNDLEEIKVVGIDLTKRIKNTSYT